MKDRGFDTHSTDHDHNGPKGQRDHPGESRKSDPGPAIRITIDTLYDCDLDGNPLQGPDPNDSKGARKGSRILSVSVPVVVRHHRPQPGPHTLELGKRDPGNTKSPNTPNTPDSPGALDLALNILGHLYPPASDGRDPVRCKVNVASATAYGLHEPFVDHFLSPLNSRDSAGGEIPVEDIRSWVQRRISVRGG